MKKLVTVKINTIFAIPKGPIAHSVRATDS